MREITPPTTMYITKLMSIETLIQRTNGMTPIEFENFADDNGIEVEWLDVCLSDYNYGFYNATLPQYNGADVFANDGSPIEINYYNY